MAPVKEGGERRKGRSAIHEAVPREHTTSTHKRIRGVGLRKRAPRHPRGADLYHEGDGDPGVRTDTRLKTPSGPKE